MTITYLSITGQSKLFKIATAPSHYTLASMVVTHLEIEIKGKLAKQRHSCSLNSPGILHILGGKKRNRGWVSELWS